MKKEEINEIITDEFLKIYFQKYKLIQWKHLPLKIEQYLLNRYKDCNNIREAYYRICNNLNEVPKCEYCKENKVKWIGRNYTKCCCKECARKMAGINAQKSLLSLSEQTKYEINEKRKNTSILRYGIDNIMKLEKIKKQIENTNIIRYGSKCPLQNKNVKEKIKQTNLKLYGSEIYPGTNDWKEKINKTSLKKYGTLYPNQSEIVKTHIKESCIEHFGVDNYRKTAENKMRANTPEVIQKAIDTKKKRHTLNTSKVEQLFREYLDNNFTNDFEYNYKSALYPFNCDFYIKSLDLYIEIQGNWTHGGHAFNENNQDDINRLNEMKSKNSGYYQNAINTWTIRDVNKRNIAKQNNLNYLEIFSANIDNVIKQFNIYLNENKGKVS